LPFQVLIEGSRGYDCDGLTRVTRIRFKGKGFTPDLVQRGLYCEDLKLEKEGEGKRGGR